MVVLFNFRRLFTTQHQSNNLQSSSSTAVAQSAGSSSTSIQTSQPVLRIFTSNRSTCSGSGPTQALLHDLDDSVVERDASKRPHPSTWSYSQITRHIAAGALLMTMSYFILCRRSKVLISNKDTVDLHLEHSYPDLTVLSIRTYPADEKFLLMNYSPWLGFNNMRTFMEQVVKVPPGTALVDCQFGEQVAFWQKVMNENSLKSSALSSDAPIFRAKDDEDEDEDEDEDGDEQLEERDGETALRNNRERISVTRVNRAKWSLDMDKNKSFIDNLIRNGLVDDLEPANPILYPNTSDGSFVAKTSFYAFGDVRGGGLNRIMSWSVDFHYQPQDVTRTLFKGIPQLDSQSCTPPTEDPSVDQIPWEARFPSFAICRIENYVGLKQELDALDARILSVEAVEEAAEYILEKLRHRLDPSPALQPSSYLKNRGAEPWFPLSMHIRRGDFVTEKYGWQEFDNDWMQTLVDNAISTVFFPLSNKSRKVFYLATDESSSTTLDYFRAMGAVMFEDLINDAFEARFGDLIVYDDWIGLVEQLICARSRKFYGTMTSSFTSGIVNLRVGKYGLDREEDFGYLIKVGGPILPQ
ncbi:MAG: hypothetical protein BYD32DRAFT_448136 [Podila humilis]|nr:MAG: hypothetical protein BYD32DRAFT_448136 [Podila humilis]